MNLDFNFNSFSTEKKISCVLLSLIAIVHFIPWYEFAGVELSPFTAFTVGGYFFGILGLIASLTGLFFLFNGNTKFNLYIALAIVFGNINWYFLLINPFGIPKSAQLVKAFQEMLSPSFYICALSSFIYLYMVLRENGLLDKIMKGINKSNQSKRVADSQTKDESVPVNITPSVLTQSDSVSEVSVTPVNQSENISDKPVDGVIQEQQPIITNNTHKSALKMPKIPKWAYLLIFLVAILCGGGYVYYERFYTPSYIAFDFITSLDDEWDKLYADDSPYKTDEERENAKQKIISKYQKPFILTDNWVQDVELPKEQASSIEFSSEKKETKYATITLIPFKMIDNTLVSIEDYYTVYAKNAYGSSNIIQPDHKVYDKNQVGIKLNVYDSTLVKSFKPYLKLSPEISGKPYAAFYVQNANLKVSFENSEYNSIIKTRTYYFKLYSIEKIEDVSTDLRKEFEAYYTIDYLSYKKSGHSEVRGDTLYLKQKKEITDTITIQDVGVYIGKVMFNKPFGEGVLTYFNGDIYEGVVSDGMPNGVGKYTYASDSSYYRGDFKNGKRDGKGLYIFKNSNIFKYDGFWSDGQMSGHGIMDYVDGSKFEGEWLYGSIVSGVLTNADGTQVVK